MHLCTHGHTMDMMYERSQPDGVACMFGCMHHCQMFAGAPVFAKFGALSNIEDIVFCDQSLDKVDHTGTSTA